MLDERRVAMLKAMGLTSWQLRASDEDAPGSQTLAEPQEPPAEMAVAPSPAPAVVRPGVPRAEPSAAIRTDLSDMDWPTLAATASACQACCLCEGRRQVVFGVGAAHSQWLVVGEAPGEQEDLKGEPFVGPSGQLLDNMLAAIGVSRAATDGVAPAPERSAYIANAIKCRPPGNRNPEPDEMASCEPFLKRQIALLRPRIILAMGRFAAQSLLRSTEPIGRLRGRVHAYEGVPLVVTYHPAYLLRNLPEKAKAWDDLVLAMTTFKASTGR